MQVPIVKLTRKQLYDEIWELSVAGVGRKYEIPYTQLMTQVKNATIPIPPSGYWTQLSFGKPTQKIELSGAFDEVISLSKELSVSKKAKLKCDNKQLKSINMQASEIATLPTEATNSELKQIELENKQIGRIVAESAVATVEPQTIKQYGQTYNIYDRETLYNEVWEAPVTEVAKKYKVSDVAIHKVCKSLDVPTPAPGYWAKLRAGKPIEKPPLPKSDKVTNKTGIQTGYIQSTPDTVLQLEFLSEEERSIVVAVASQVMLPDADARMHSKIIAHRKIITDWHKQEKAQNNQWRPRNASPKPFLVESISEDSIPRACHIIDALIKALEPLGCKLTNELSFMVNDETVSISFSESQDKVNHVLTKEENRKLLEYEERRKKYSWESKPQIRKYDYHFNGRLSCTVNDSKTFRDCKAYQLEDRLGDIILELYIAAEYLKQKRLAREEAERIREEEARKKEEKRKRYNEEVDRTIALENLAEDYDTACKIRAYIEAYKKSHLDEDISEWVAWANKKADWYDPTISKEDPLLGTREHEKGKDAKTPKHAGYYW
ncbi:MAG: hypothetical protein RR846_09970 [Oscillospiraceae bacterium]